MTTYYDIIIDVYTKCANRVYHSLKNLSWVEDVSYGAYRACPECSAIRVRTKGKTVEDVEAWLGKKSFKGLGLYETWIGVVYADQEGADIQF